MVIKTLNISFDEEEYNKLREVKGDLTWKDWILSIAEKEVKKDGRQQFDNKCEQPDSK